MKDQLKKVLTVALEEKYPEVKNIIIIQNEYIGENLKYFTSEKFVRIILEKINISDELYMEIKNIEGTA